MVVPLVSAKVVVGLLIPLILLHHILVAASSTPSYSVSFSLSSSSSSSAILMSLLRFRLRGLIHRIPSPSSFSSVVSSSTSSSYY